MMCFYHVQGDKGDSEAHPNAFLLPSGSDESGLFLEDFVRVFPLAGTAAFHYRFQVPTPSGKAFMDLVNPKDKVPVVNGSVFAKVLRLDSLKSASTSKSPLPLGSPVPCFKSVPPIAASQPPEAPAVKRSGSSTTPRTAAVATPAVQVRAPAPATAPPVPARAPAPARPTVAAPEPESEPDLIFAVPSSPSKRGGLEVDSPRPERVDEDLAGKSEWVQARVMARREEEARKAEERLAAVRAVEEAKAKAEAAKDAYKALLGPKLKEWSEGTGGVKRDVRGLLSSLHLVLWPGAKWEEVPISKLIEPSRVKFYFHKASRVTHPDHNNTSTDEQKFIANFVFHVLEGQYRVFEAAELARA